MGETRFKIYSLMVVKNEADVIAASLTDACRWSDKIIVIDNGSSDGTWETVQALSHTYPQIIPWLRYEGPFHIGLRAKAFRAFRHELHRGDWWNVRLDADEFYPGDVRERLENIPTCYTTVKKESRDYVLTQEDLTQPFTGDFTKDRPFITHSLPDTRCERRFMRHSPWLCWSERWRYPHPWGRVAPATIPVEHFQYRSPMQMAKRFATRQQAKTDGCGSFKHELGQCWQDYVMTNTQLEERHLLAHIKEAFEASENVLYQGRNTLKIIGQTMVAKCFHSPRFPNNLIYGTLRASKAERSYRNALLLGELTPEPLAFYENRRCGLLQDSYYVCRLSELPLTWRIVARDPLFPNRQHIASRIGVLMAQMHEKGWFALDFSGGNILVDEKGTKAQIVDINRMRHVTRVSMEKGCRQTSRLHLNEADCRALAEAYARMRGFDPEKCVRLISKHHIPIP